MYYHSFNFYIRYHSDPSNWCHGKYIPFRWECWGWCSFWAMIVWTKRVDRPTNWQPTSRLLQQSHCASMATKKKKKTDIFSFRQSNYFILHHTHANNIYQNDLKKPKEHCSQTTLIPNGWASLESVCKDKLVFKVSYCWTNLICFSCSF